MRRKCLTLTLCVMFLCTASPARAEAAPFGYQTVVNKEHRLAKEYVPADLVPLTDYMNAREGTMLDRTAAEALREMVSAMAGIADVYGRSGYRSYATQAGLHANLVRYYREDCGCDPGTAYARASRSVAPPGTSEHQTGYAVDLTTSENGHQLIQNFEDTRAGKWLCLHAWEYGFVLRYPKGMSDVTGIIYEPWHFRYVGRIHAWYLHHSGLCLEEYAARIDAGGVRWRYRDMRYEVTAGKPGLGTTLTECALYTDGGTVYTTVCAMPARGTLWPLQ
ncbi:MAG: M15 family metallopeptidase [Clostridiales bacterium]|nr:M15 family metallopeptidase [Clostridiales bacterium]